MYNNDQQLGKPQTLFKGTTAELDALSAVEGMQAYDTTLDKFVYYDGSNWAEVGGGGHTIEDEGTTLTQRTNLNFVGSSVAVTDDSANDRTIVTISDLVISGNVSPGICQGRLTLTSGVPYQTADQTAKTTLYFTPYNGNFIGLFDGTDTWTIYAITEKSISLAGLTADTNYDVFMYDNSGTPTLELLAWTDATTRATALTTQDGILVKTGATTRRYLGTIRTTATTGQCQDSLARRFVWNYYNRLEKGLRGSTYVEHTYNSNTKRFFNNNTALFLDYVSGEEQYGNCAVHGGVEQQSGYGGALILNLDTPPGGSTLASIQSVANVRLEYSTADYKVFTVGYHKLCLSQQVTSGTAAYKFAIYSAMIKC